MTKFMDDKITEQIEDLFAELQEPVSILFFEKEACTYCEDARQLIQEVAALSEKLDVQIYDLQEDVETAEQYNVDKAPTLVLAAREGDAIQDYGVRYAGIPAGHEFGSLVNDLVQVSSRDSGLQEKTRQFIGSLTQPLHMQVFVTPTCPHCPRAVLTAHQMALESDLIQAEMVEATEFPELSQQYNISGVPNTIINHGAGSVLGGVPEGMLVEELQKMMAVA